MNKTRSMKNKCYQIFLASTGELLAQTDNLNRAEKMLLAYQRTYNYIKIVEKEGNKTILEVS